MLPLPHFLLKGRGRVGLHHERGMRSEYYAAARAWPISPRSGPHPFSSKADEKGSKPGPSISSSAGPVTAREWDVAHAAVLRALLTQPPAGLPTRLAILCCRCGLGSGMHSWLCCGPGLSRRRICARASGLHAQHGYFMACARKDAMRHDLKRASRGAGRVRSTARER